jgi:DNA-binding CsgD family transcriptional regulator
MKDWHLVESAFLDAAVGRGTWRDAMNVASEVTGSRGALLFPASGRIGELPMSQAMDETTDAYFRGGWHERDERFAGLAHLKSVGFTTEFDFTSPERMRQSPYFEEFLRPFGLRWFAGVGIRSGAEVWSLSLQRTFEQGPFQQDELLALRSLARRLDAAADLSRAIALAQVKSAGEAFEYSKTAAVFVDRAGRLVHSNDAAGHLFTQGDLRLAGNRIRLRAGSAQGPFDRGLSDVLAARDRRSSAMIAIDRPMGRGLLARVIRFEHAFGSPMSMCHAVVIFHDLDRGPERQRETWQHLFGLTESECRLMEALQKGLSLEEAANSFDLSKETIRSRIKIIFGKTQTSRQGELLALFGRIPG